MCDERTTADNEKYMRANKLTRREFGAVSAEQGSRCYSHGSRTRRRSPSLTSM